MIAQLPIWLNFLFLATTLSTLAFFYLANNKALRLTAIFIAIAVLHSFLAYLGIYQNIDSFPPNFFMVLIIPILLIIYGLQSKQITWMKKNRKLRLSTLLHVIRIPVEICLFYLFIYKMIPELMTYHGRNFDILSGLTAPIAWLLYSKNIIAEKGLITWNVICLGLVLFIAANGILSAELPFQKFAFDQPNKALLYFPFVLLPALIVPIVIYTHISDIIFLRSKIAERNKAIS